MTFEEAAKKTSSEKVILVKASAEHLVKVWELHSGNIFKRKVNHFVSSVKEAGEAFEQKTSIASLTAGSFFYESFTQTLFIICLDSSSPKSKEISLVYNFFFSTAPVILPHDLGSGIEVEWVPIVSKIGNLGQQLSEESTGVVLESSSSVDFINTDGFFDEIYDVLLWENKPISFYLWFPETPITEVRKVFEGVIESRDFSLEIVVFNVKDFVIRLRDRVKLGSFSEEDGRISDSLIGKPKRRIYGQVKQARAIGIDKILEGFSLTGVVSITVGSNTLKGSETFFLKELSVGDEITINVDDIDYNFAIESVSSDILATVNKLAEINFLSVVASVKPINSFRFLNRKWHLAGHKLKKFEPVITQVVNARQFKVESVKGLFHDDYVYINNILTQITRITGNDIVLEQSIFPEPIVGDKIEKLAVQNVFFNNKKMTFARDWSYQNTNEAIVVFNELAEFNVTQERSLGSTITFTSGSNTLSTTETVDFRSILKPRDWIRKNSVISGQNDWYEIIAVNQQQIIIRSTYTGSTETTTALVKVVDYIKDDSLITCDCMGLDNDGEWLKTPSEVVKHLVMNDAGFTSVSEESFQKAKTDCDYIISIVIPEAIEGDSPHVRDIVTKINESVFGSLYSNKSLLISYSILNAEKPLDEIIIKDDDILSFDSRSQTEIYNNVICSYRPFIDIQNGSDAFEISSYNSGFVDRFIGLKNTLNRTLYLYEKDKSEIIAQRLALFYSMSNTKIVIRGKMNFFLNTVNDKIVIAFDRLFKRYGGKDKRRIGILTGIKKGNSEVELEISDLGNVYNRVPAICPDYQAHHSASTGEEILKWGYIVDNETLTPNPTSEIDLGNNLIG